MEAGYGGQSTQLRERELGWARRPRPLLGLYGVLAASAVLLVMISPVVAVASEHTSSTPHLSSPHTLSAGAPGVPYDVQATGSAGSATVTWIAPPQGAVALIAYFITPSPACVSTTTNTCGGLIAAPSATSTVVTGLSNSVSYTFSVTALNSFGFGAPSEPSSEAVVSSAKGSPSAPRDVVASAQDKHILVSFNPPANDGGTPITGYKITADPAVKPAPEISGISLGCLIGFQGYCLLYPPGTQTTPLATGAWQMEFAGKPNSFILHVSCATASSCIAVGTSVSLDGFKSLSYSPYVVATQNAGASWHEVPFPSSPGLVLTSVSCTSATSCVAGGFPAKLSLSAKPEIFYTSNTGTTWEQAFVPSSVESLGGISCVASSSTCFAVGLHSLSSSEVIESSDSGAHWQATKSAPPSGIVSLLVPLVTGDAISCASVSTCVFVGARADLSLKAIGFSPASVVTTNAGASWSASSMGAVQGPLALDIPDGISCASTSSCVAIGTNFFGAQASVAWQTNDTGATWSEENPIAGLGAHAILYAVSCATTGTCYVAGSSISAKAVIAPVLEGTSDAGGIWQPENVATQPGSVLALMSVSCAPSTTTCTAGGLIGSSSGLQAGIAGAEDCGAPGALCTTLSTSASPGAQYQVPDATNGTTYQVSVTALNANGFSVAGAAVYPVTPVEKPQASYGTGALPVLATLIHNPANGFSYTSNLLTPAPNYGSRNVDRDCGQSSVVNVSGTTTPADLWVFCDTFTRDFNLIPNPSQTLSTKPYHFTPSGTAAVQYPLGSSAQPPSLFEDLSTGTPSTPSWPSGFTCPYSTVGKSHKTGLPSPIQTGQPCPFLPSEGPYGTNTTPYSPKTSATITIQDLLATGKAPPSDPDNDSDNDASSLGDQDASGDAQNHTTIPLSDYCLVSANELSRYNNISGTPPPDCANLRSAGFVTYSSVTTQQYECNRWTAGLVTLPKGAFTTSFSTTASIGHKVLDYYQNWCFPLTQSSGDSGLSEIVLLTNTEEPGQVLNVGASPTLSPSVGVGEVTVTGSTANTTNQLSPKLSPLPGNGNDALFTFPSPQQLPSQQLPCSWIPPATATSQATPVYSCDSTSPSTPQYGFASGAVLGPTGNHLYMYTPVSNWSHLVYVARLNLARTTNRTPPAGKPACAQSAQVWQCQWNYQYFFDPSYAPGSPCPSTSTSTSWTTDSKPAAATPVLSTCPRGSWPTTVNQALIAGGTFSVSKVPTDSGAKYVMVYQPAGGPYSGEMQFAVAPDPWGPFTWTTSVVIPGCATNIDEPGMCYDYLLHPELDPAGNTNLVFSYFQQGTYNDPDKKVTGHVRFAMVPMSCVVTAGQCPTSQGYWEVASDGGVFSFNVPFYGSMGGKQLNAPIVGIAATPDAKGYWEVGADGGIFSYGDASFYGSMGGKQLNAPIVGIAATPDGAGYWEVASDGGVFSFGDANFYGSMGGKHLNAPIVGIAATPDGHGYWLVASDGGIFCFGDASFYHSMGGKHLNAPIVGMARTLDGGGYWLVASDGGVFSFGDAKFYGSMGAEHLNAPIAGIASTLNGGGYWLVGADGGIFCYANAGFHGSMGLQTLNAPVVGIAAVGGAPS